MKEEKDKIEFYKELHFNELNRKEEIDSSISFPTTLLTLLIGGGLYLFKKDNFEIKIDDNQYLINTILILTLIFIIFIVISIVLLMRMYLNKFKKYKYLPLSSDLLKREKELYNYFKNHFKSIDEEEENIEEKTLKYSNSEFRKDLINYYVEFSTNNQIVNDRRLKDYYKSRKYLMFSIIFIGIIGILILIK